MLSNSNEKLRNVKCIRGCGNYEQRIKDFLQGAVYSWCKNRKDEPFSLQILMGGDNFYWNGTPLYKLFEEKNKINSDNAVTEAAKAAGWLLKQVLSEDKHRTYEVIEGYTKFYRCIKWNQFL